MREEKRSNTELRADLNRHYDNMQTHVDKGAREVFKRPAYKSIDVAEYVRRKYGIRGDAGGECKTDKREEIQHK